MLLSMRHRETHERVLLAVAFAVSTIVSAAYASSIFYGPLLEGDLTNIPGTPSIPGSKSQVPTLEFPTENTTDENETITSTTTTNNGETQTIPPTGECVLRISQCSPSDPACLEALMFIRGLCSDARCLNGKAVCTPVVMTGTSGSSSPDIGNTLPSGSTQGAGERPTVGNTSSIPDPVSGGSNNTTDTGRTEPLGCYSRNGTWTTDRSACAEDQSSFLPVLSEGPKRPVGTQGQPSIENDTSSDTNNSGATSAQQTERTSIEQDREDSALQEAFREIFTPNAAPQPDALSSLLQTSTDALERMERLLDTPLPEDARRSAEDTRQWIGDFLSNLTTNPQTDSDIEDKAVELKQRLEETTQAVARSLRPVTPRPSTVLDTMDRIFATLPSVFAFLQEQGAPVSRDAANAYLSAATLYGTTKTACLKTAGECAGLDRVISELETMRDEMTQTLEETGKTDLQGRIDEMLQ